MMSKYCFESLDRTLKDIISSPEEKSFGGKVVLVRGDFRQILHVIVVVGRELIVNSSLNSSYLWQHCKILKLTKNMRLLQDIDVNNARVTKEFSKWILAVGEGKLNEPNDGVAQIQIPDDILIPKGYIPTVAIIKAVYGTTFTQEKSPTFSQDKAILCPTNDDVNSINDHMISKLTS